MYEKSAPVPELGVKPDVVNAVHLERGQPGAHRRVLILVQLQPVRVVGDERDLESFL
jgi:hypothetical protein